MKFNQQLKHALQALEAAIDARRTPEPPQPEPPRDPRTPLYIRERVVGGDLLRTPANRQAALVSAKPPWWAYPIEAGTQSNIHPIEPPKEPPKVKTMKTQTADPHIQQKDDQIKRTPETLTEREARVQAFLERQSAHAVKETCSLTEQALGAKAAVALLGEDWKEIWVVFMNTTRERLVEFQQARMAITTEMETVIKKTREVRQLLLDPAHERELERLKDFVSVCERLADLEASGTLARVADVMLNLACGQFNQTPVPVVRIEPSPPQEWPTRELNGEPEF